VTGGGQGEGATGGADAVGSWIVEVRGRLADPPPRALAEAAAPAGRAAALVPLYVEAGNLWTVLTERAAPPGRTSPLAFPGAVLAPDEDPWAAALRGARTEAGLLPRAALDLGRLDEAATPAGVRIAPCVAALPATAVAERAEPADAAAVSAVVPLPLTALAAPQAVERREVELDGRIRELAVFHVGRHRIWGVTAALAGSLLARLGLGGPMTADGA